MQHLPLINKVSAPFSKAESHRTISAKSCLLLCAPRPPQHNCNRGSRAINTCESLAKLHCDRHDAATIDT